MKCWNGSHGISSKCIFAVAMSEGQDDDQVYLSVEEVAEMLRRTPKAIEKMTLEGRGPPCRWLGGPGVGKAVYCRAEVRAWLKAKHRR